MAHPLFTHIQNYAQWAQTPEVVKLAKVDGYWESEYPGWADIYTGLEDFLKTVPATQLTGDECERLLYIIARDNESEVLADTLAEHPEAFATVAHAGIDSPHHEAKWQLAIHLHLLPDRLQALNLVEAFVNDADEYTNRRALMAMADLKSEKTQHYCEKFWNRKLYGPADQYQRMVVLYALNTIQSPRLKHYLDLAKQDGRPYLLEKAMEIEGERG